MLAGMFVTIYVVLFNCDFGLFQSSTLVYFFVFVLLLLVFTSVCEKKTV